MWFFVPASLIGIYKWFSVRKWYEPETFFIIAFTVLYSPVMVWLYCKHDYMSNRHTLPLSILCLLYVPVGLNELAIWLTKKFSVKTGLYTAENWGERSWFLVLFLIGITICAPKLLTPIRAEKQGYRAAAEWLKANTDIAATVAVPDKRINFYAQRQGPVYDNGNIPANTVYTVIVPKQKKEKSSLMEPQGKIEYEYVNKGKKGVDVIIYGNF